MILTPSTGNRGGCLGNASGPGEYPSFTGGTAGSLAERPAVGLHDPCGVAKSTARQGRLGSFALFSQRAGCSGFGGCRARCSFLRVCQVLASLFAAVFGYI